MTAQMWNSSQSQAKSLVPKKAQGENYHLKLWIGTIKSLIKHPEIENSAVFDDLCVTHVDIFGTVTDIVHLAKVKIYVVDDGTGVISCHIKKNEANSENIDNLRTAIQNDSSIMLISKENEEGIETLLTSLEREEKEFNIGDTLQIKGRLSYHKEEWKLYANITRVIDFQEECYRCIELGCLYENIYNSK